LSSGSLHSKLEHFKGTESKEPKGHLGRRCTGYNRVLLHIPSLLGVVHQKALGKTISPVESSTECIQTFTGSQEALYFLSSLSLLGSLLCGKPSSPLFWCGCLSSDLEGFPREKKQLLTLQAQGIAL